MNIPFTVPWGKIGALTIRSIQKIGWLLPFLSVLGFTIWIVSLDPVTHDNFMWSTFEKAMLLTVAGAQGLIIVYQTAETLANKVGSLFHGLMFKIYSQAILLWFNIIGAVATLAISLYVGYPSLPDRIFQFLALALGAWLIGLMYRAIDQKQKVIRVAAKLLTLHLLGMLFASVLFFWGSARDAVSTDNVWAMFSAIVYVVIIMIILVDLSLLYFEKRHYRISARAVVIVPHMILSLILFAMAALVLPESARYAYGSLNLAGYVIYIIGWAWIIEAAIGLVVDVYNDVKPELRNL